MQRHISKSTEAIRFRYHAFYGSFQNVQDYPPTWYTRGIRIMKLGIGANTCHYGWSRSPEIMRAKRVSQERLYRDDASVAEMSLETGAVYYDPGNLHYFRGTHPAVMRTAVESQNWLFDHGIERQKPDWYRHARVWSDLYLHRALPFAEKAGQHLWRSVRSR